MQNKRNVAELADAPDSKSDRSNREGSIPSVPTNLSDSQWYKEWVEDNAAGVKEQTLNKWLLERKKKLVID